MRKGINLLLTVFLLAFISQVYAASIQWRSYSSAAFAQAKSSHRLVLVYAKTAWCPWCKRMMGNYAQPQIISLINKNFVPVMIDVDQEPVVAKNLGVNGFPTIVIMDADRRIIDTYSGYMSAESLADTLQGAIGTQRR